MVGMVHCLGAWRQVAYCGDKNMTYHMQDLKDLPRTGAWYTGAEVGIYCAASFVFGALCSVMLLISMSMGG